MTSITDHSNDDPATTSAGTAPHLRACAGDVMSSPVITVGAWESVGTAWNLLAATGFRHLIVVDGQRCVGMIDDRWISQHRLGGPLELNGIRVCDVVPARVHCVLADTPVAKIAQIMRDERVDAVPVITENGDLQGLVTVGDLLGLLA